MLCGGRLLVRTLQVALLSCQPPPLSSLFPAAGPWGYLDLLRPQPQLRSQVSWHFLTPQASGARPGSPPHLHPQVEEAAVLVGALRGLQDEVLAAPCPCQLCRLCHVVPVHTDEAILWHRRRPGSAQLGAPRRSPTPWGRAA